MAKSYDKRPMTKQEKMQEKNKRQERKKARGRQWVD